MFTQTSAMVVPFLLHIATVSLLWLTAVFDLGNAKSINFHSFRPPAAATPFPRSFKCFTCEHASDNYSCNRWAEDKWCPQNTQLCMTVHRFSGHGKSRSVTKRCAVREDCYAVGCRHHIDTGHTECVSCCDGMACNVDVPTNHTNAVLAVRHHALSSSAALWDSCKVLWRTLVCVCPVLTAVGLL